MILGCVLESDGGGVQSGPVEEFGTLTLAGKFIDYHKDEDDKTDGVVIEINYGHGYGFNHGTELKTFYPGDSLKFTVKYTDTSNGTWTNEWIDYQLTIFESDKELEISYG